MNYNLQIGNILASDDKQLIWFCPHTAADVIYDYEALYTRERELSRSIKKNRLF